jgi:hypothetical protein
MRRWRDVLAALGCLVLVGMYAGTCWFSWRGKGLTFDEPLHLVGAAIQHQHSTFAYDAENPPVWKYYFAVGNPAMKMKLKEPSEGWDAFFHDPQSMPDYSRQVFYQTPGNDAEGLARGARGRMLLLAVALDGLIAWCAWRFGGPLAGVVAAAAFSLDPNFLAHGLIVKNDVPLALLMLAFSVAVWRVGRAAGLGNFFALAVILGMIITTKFSGLLAIFILGVCLLVRVLVPGDWRVFRYVARKRAGRLVAAVSIGLAAVLFSWGFVWACYGFRYQSAADESLDMSAAVASYSAAATVAEHGANLNTPGSELDQWRSEWRPDHLLGGDLWVDVHHLLPHEYCAGLLYAGADSLSRGSYFMGDFRLTGWWYYFPCVMAFKTPLATLVGLVLAVVAIWFLPLPGDVWAICVFAIAPLLYMLAAMHSAMDIGIRHIFPVYPYLYIFLGVAAGRAAVRFKKGIMVILILFLGLAAETFAAFPDFIPFFNIAAGGSRGGPRLLSDSNIDWGQELPGLARWQGDHADYQLMLSYVGSADPRYYGIRYVNLPGSSAPEDQANASGRPKRWAISVIVLQGEFQTVRRQEFYEPFREREPSEIIGGAIYVYEP